MQLVWIPLESLCIKVVFSMKSIWQIVQPSVLAMGNNHVLLAELICWILHLATCRFTYWMAWEVQHLHCLVAGHCARLEHCWTTTKISSSTRTGSLIPNGLQSRCFQCLLRTFQLTCMVRFSACQLQCVMFGLEDVQTVRMKLSPMTMKFFQFSWCQTTMRHAHQWALWPKDWEAFKLDYDMSLPPCAQDDPRLLGGFPCYTKHKSKERRNQHATWKVCTVCGLRTEYQCKSNKTGESRHMGPHPHLVSLALEQIQQQVPANQVQEKMVVGKLMELKGIQLQQGLTETMALNMTLEQYRRRMGMDQSSSAGYPNQEATPKKSQTTLLLEGAEKYLKEKGLDNLDPTEFQAACLAHVEGRALPKSQAQPKLKPKTEPKETSAPVPSAAMEGVLTVSSEEEDEQPASPDRGVSSRSRRPWCH